MVQNLGSIIKTPQAEQHAALDNRNIIEQSPIINLPELDTEKLTEELGDVADEAGREADELGREADQERQQIIDRIESKSTELANEITEIIKQYDWQSWDSETLEAVIENGVRDVLKNSKIFSGQPYYDDWVKAIKAKTMQNFSQ